jgi:hypothetical protein
MAAAALAAMAISIWCGMAEAQQSAAASMPRRCSYDIHLQDRAALVLNVSVTCNAGPRVEFDRPGGGGEIAALADYEEGDDGLSLRYRFRLGDLAALANSPDIAQRVGAAVISPLSIWLADPQIPDAEIALRVTADPGLGFALCPPEEDGVRRLRGEDLRFGGYAVFGQFDRRLLSIGDAAIELITFPGRLVLPGPVLERWITDSATAVSQYFGGFPLQRTLLVAVPVAGHSGVIFGRVRGGGGGTILLRLGELVSKAELHEDWMLVHEMVHLGAPFVTGRASWLMEGMATYAEPIIRERAGWHTPAQLWQEFASQMRHGLPALTSESLNAVSSRGIYWGGALFMLLADLDIREHSDGEASLETCFRAILKAGGDTTVRWPRRRVLAACDAATGTGTMARLEDRYVSEAGPLDLDALWKDLGVTLDGGKVVFDETAPRAALRRAITRGAAGD